MTPFSLGRPKEHATDTDEHIERDPGEASEAAYRKIMLLLDLLRTKAVRFSSYERVYGRGYRSFSRDLQHLRKIGEEAGYTISPIKNKERATLTVVDSELRSLDASPQMRGLLAAIGGALGAPVTRELGALAGDAAQDGFLKFVMPQLVEQTQVGETYERLRAAWKAKPRPAIVRFDYDPGKGKRTTRRVEPYRLMIRSGSSYLVGFDLEKRGWRLFALDRFCSLPEVAGTVQALRTVPPDYDSSDTIGFFKLAQASAAVTVELTPAVAASATSRRWQAAQRVEQLPGGRARITFDVSDCTEVVRWALGFGKEARVVAPPEAVGVAQAMVAEIAAEYGSV